MWGIVLEIPSFVHSKFPYKIWILLLADLSLMVFISCDNRLSRRFLLVGKVRGGWLALRPEKREREMMSTATRASTCERYHLWIVPCRQIRAVLYSLDAVVGDIHTHQVVVSAFLSHALLARESDF